MKKLILVALAVIIWPVLLLGCSDLGSPSGSATIQGNVEELENTGTVEGRTWYMNPDRNLLKGVHITFTSGGQTYSTDSGLVGWYSIELPSTSEPGISYTIHATAEGCQPYEGNITVVAGRSIMRDIEMVMTR